LAAIENAPAIVSVLLGDVWILAGGASLAWPLWRLRQVCDRV
jgi:hypothetical protein